MARIVAVTLLLLGLFAASLPAALAADKVALVVGNNQYAHAPRLLNPSRDARAIAGTLRSIGFDVMEHYDVDKKAMDTAMEEFARKARDARIGLVYYAGHGIQVHGNAYLVPVDVALEDDRDLRRLVPADYLMQDASKASSLGVVILDACRDNPFLKRIAEASGATRSMVVGRGLARISDVPKNTLIAYATQTGNVALDGDGENSPYAAALIKHLPAPGKDVRLIFGAVRDEVISVTGHQQEPYTYGSLGGEAIVINESPAGAGEAVVVPPATGKTAGIPGQGAGPRDSTALTSAYAAWRTAIDGNDWKRLDSLAGKGSLFALLAGELAGASRSEPVGRAIASLA
ncbi:MAG: caspase domain-containing protein, partial [Hyphomicrobiales bacterium]